MPEKKNKKSVFETPFLSTKIKSANVKIFPEGILGYFLGPTLALLANSILSGYLNMYMTNVLNLNVWANTFLSLLPFVSVAFIILGNIIVGRLMDKNSTKAGKARPLLLMSIPLSILALMILFFFAPFVNDASSQNKKTLALVLLAIGYNLWFAIAYPFYSTSHAALVNLSTRNGKARSLLATISNATALSAMGLCSMVLPFFLGLLFVYDMNPTAADAIPVLAKNGTDILYYTYGEGGAIIYDQVSSYNHWKIFIIALIAVTFVGVLIEYFFTRERVTEESFANLCSTNKKFAQPVSKQAKVCVQDKYWWIIIVFFFLYQLGGMLKNISQLYYCQAMFSDSNGNYSTSIGGGYQGTLSIIGAIPTALGMLIAWPFANKIGKSKAILFGSIISVLGGIIGFISPTNIGVVTESFVIKALGSTPAMYLSLALLADVLDHQEAVSGFRTDGFTMTIYGAIMAGMTGVATGIMNGVLGLVGYSADNVSSPAIQSAMTWLFIGGETICYFIIIVLFIFMGVEKFSTLDKRAIEINRKEQALAEGVEYIDSMTKLRLEEQEAERISEEARLSELKARCIKKGLNFEEEEEKYHKALLVKQAEIEKKKALNEEKQAAKKRAIKEKNLALSAERKEALLQIKEKKENEMRQRNITVLNEFNKLRERNNKPPLND